ncbi:hypothetical protein R3Q06_12425 [Rhodococcus erythropolis]|uniref:hypothetical protein n=1 Tax=Rhodococcus erythropolis TaxID=1833 RepID=UPI00294A029E|nr:hypothetical protein [Rhodococcus erythropolis]MDV6274309.1 hypothetical protein [Rhodococcus erythropolis]
MNHRKALPVAAKGFELNRPRFNRELAKRGLQHPAKGKLAGSPKVSALALQMGMDKSSVSRVVNDIQLPGADFVRNLMRAWDLEFHDLFKDTPPRPLRLQASDQRMKVSA